MRRSVFVSALALSALSATVLLKLDVGDSEDLGLAIILR